MYTNLIREIELHIQRRKRVAGISDMWTSYIRLFQPYIPSVLSLCIHAGKAVSDSSDTAEKGIHTGIGVDTLKDLNDLPDADNIRFYYYHRYDDKLRPVVTVCLLEHTYKSGWQRYFRGIALCQPMDYGNLSKKEGRRIAREHAIRGYKLYKSPAGEINQRFSEPSLTTICKSRMRNDYGNWVIPWVSEYRYSNIPVALSPWEKSIINKIRHNRSHNIPVQVDEKVAENTTPVTSNDLQTEIRTIMKDISPGSPGSESLNSNVFVSAHCPPDKIYVIPRPTFDFLKIRNLI